MQPIGCDRRNVYIDNDRTMTVTEFARTFVCDACGGIPTVFRKYDENGNVTITFSKNDPKDGTYWMPVLDTGYYFIARYYGPTPRLNGNTAHDIVYKGTQFEDLFKAVKF